MAVYRFRVCLEENEDIYRDIDILSSQNFEQFHECIQEAFKFDKKHAASFFVSDDYWRKGEEITLRKEDLKLNEEDRRKKIAKKYLMADCKIAKFIEQPHQRFVYVFDETAQWSFILEMLKIVNEDTKVSYPSCIRSFGNAPKQYRQINPVKDELSPELAIAALLSDPEMADDEIYKEIETVEEGIEEDDIANLEGEEGEEEELEEDFGVSDDMPTDDFEEENI